MTEIVDAPAEPTGALPAALLPAGAVPLPPDKNHPDGNWVVLRDYHDLDGGDVIDAMGSLVSGQGYGKAITSLRVAMVSKLVTNWSFDHLPLPATETVLRMLPGHVLVALFALVKPAVDMVNGTSVVPVLSAEALADPASPTQGSSE